MDIVATKSPDTVGLRETRANLSRYVTAVKSGKTFTLTQNGRPVARLVPMVGQSSYERLVAQGVITPAVSRSDRLAAPIAAGGTVSDLVAEQRR